MMPIEMTLNGAPRENSQSAPLSRSEQQDLLLAQHRSVFLFCLGFTGNQCDARDLTQETFLRALTHLHRMPVDRIRPWLLTLARNICIDQIRRRKIRQFFQPRLAHEHQETHSPDLLLSQKEEIGQLRAAIRSLPRPLREVLVLREYGELSYQEIASVLGQKEGTIMSRLNRARKALVKAVKECSMENQIDKEWAVISRLIEKDKEAAWAVGRNQSPILYTRHRRRLHPLALSAALFVLALLVGSGIHLFRTPAAAIQNPLTFDRLPFFASLRSAAQDSPQTPFSSHRNGPETGLGTGDCPKGQRYHHDYE
jgi:RNA polymerase sigma-70 factor (ECF subfamily)